MKHIADKQHETGAGRVLHFTQHEREAGLHPAVASLHTRSRDEATENARRLREFARIERGQLV